MPHPGADTVLVGEVRTALRDAADPARAEPMRAYMKSAMPFLGIARPVRSRVLSPLFRAHRPPDRLSWEATVRKLWDGAAYREERYAATDLARSRAAAAWASDPRSLPLYDHLIVTGGWWDHVDDVAIHPVGPVLRSAPDGTADLVRRWWRDDDRWRRRSSVICQVGLGADLDAGLLREAILANVDDPDFFLRKGIGWALRQHSRTDPAWVEAFVAAHADQLSALSRREALRVLHPT